MGLFTIFKAFAKKKEIKEKKNNKIAIEDVNRKEDKKIFYERNNEDRNKEAYMRKMNEIMISIAKECEISSYEKYQLPIFGIDKIFDSFKDKLRKENIKQYARRVFRYNGRYYPIFHLNDFTECELDEDTLLVGYQMDKAGTKYNLFDVVTVRYSKEPTALIPTSKQKKYFYKNPAMVIKVNEYIKNKINKK